MTKWLKRHSGLIGILILVIMALGLPATIGLTWVQNSGLLSADAVVFASDAPAMDRFMAKAMGNIYGDRLAVCDGSSDQVEIAAAITAGAGGVVELRGNTFDLDLSGSALTLSANTTLSGSGMNTCILTCSTGRAWGSIKMQDGCALTDLTIVGQGIANEHLVYASTSVGSSDITALIENVRAKNAGSRNFYLYNSSPYSYSASITLNDCISVDCTGTGNNEGAVLAYAVNNLTINNLQSSGNYIKALIISLNNNTVARIVNLYSNTDAGGIKLLNGVADSWFGGRKIDIINPHIYNCGNMAIEASGVAGMEYMPVTITGGVIDKASGNGIDPGGGRGWTVVGTRVTRCNFGGAGWAQIEDGTGAFTGSPVKLKVGANTITCTAAGTAIVRMPQGATTSSTAASGTATVTGSPVTLSSQYNTITVEGAGNITITVVDTSMEGSAFTNGHECKLIGCTLENNWRSGVSLWQNDRTSVSGCTIRNNDQGAGSTYFGVTIWAYTAGDTAYYNTVEDCIIGDDQTVAAKTLTDNATAATKLVKVSTTDIDNFFPGQYVTITDGGDTETNWVDYVTASGIYVLYPLTNTYHVPTGATITGTATQDYGIFEHETDGDCNYNTYTSNSFYNNTVSPMHLHGNNDTIHGNNGYLGKGEQRTYAVTITAGAEDTCTYWQNPFAQDVWVVETRVALTTAASATNPTYDLALDTDGSGVPDGTKFHDAIPDTVGTYWSWSAAYGGAASGVQAEMLTLASNAGASDWIGFCIEDAAGADVAGVIYITLMGV